MRTYIQRVLISLSKVIKIDLGYLMRGGTLLGTTQATSAIIGLLMTIAFARYLPQDVYGTYRYILATYTLIAIASLPGIDSALIETISKGNQGAFRYGMKIKFKWGLLASLISLGFAGYHFFTGETTLMYCFILVAVFLPCMESLSLYTNYLNAERRYGFWTATEIANQVLSLITLFTTIYFTDNIIVLVAVYFLTYIIIRLWTTLHILKHFIHNNNLDTSFIGYGKLLSWYQIITKAIANIDQLVLFHYIGPVQLAVFSIANAVPQRMQSVFKISGTLAFPKFATQNEKQINSRLASKMILFGMVILLCCVGYVIIAPHFFSILFPKYIESVSYSQVLVFLTLSGMTYPFGSFLVTHKKIRENYIFAISSFAVKAFCLVIFVPIYGIWGAIIGVLASSYTTIAMTFYYVRKFKNAPESEASPHTTATI